MRQNLLVYYWIWLVVVMCLIFFVTAHFLQNPSTKIVSLFSPGHDRTLEKAKTSIVDLTIRYNHTSPVVLTNNQDSMNLLRAEGLTQRLIYIDLAKLTLRQMSLTLHSYLDNINIICQRKVRMGNIGMGGWEVCDDPDVRPQSPSIIYSFGIGSDFSFDDDISKWYKCHVFSFDPTIAQKSHNRSEYVHFYEAGIAARNRKDSQAYKTLSDIRSMLGHDKHNVRIIKMNIDGNEWDVLIQMIKSRELEYVDQLLIQFHIPPKMNSANLRRSLSVLQGLEMNNMKIFYTHKNVECEHQITGFPPKTSGCFQVHYRRTLGVR